MKKLILTLTVVLLVTSCVSKKKYVALEQQLTDTKGSLQKTTLAKEELEAKMAKIQQRVENYNNKINSLRNVNASLESTNSGLQRENDIKLDMVGNVAVMSKAMKRRMNETLAKVHPSVLAQAKDLKDSLNIAMSYNLKRNIDTSDLENYDDININIDQTVVMISISDKLLFNTASYKVNRKAYKLLGKLAEIMKSEPSMDVMVEGHTDARSIHNAVVQDNWDLSVKRATSIVRLLETKFNVPANRLIASGRGSSMPLVGNSTREDRARNRRTRIIILPNLDKFFGLLAQDGTYKP